MVDLGLTHVALPVSHLNDSIAFYATYARMQVAGGAPAYSAHHGVGCGVDE